METVKQNVMFPLARRRTTLKRRDAEERALHYLDKVGLGAFADAYPHTLSGGMKAAWPSPAPWRCSRKSC